MKQRVTWTPRVFVGCRMNADEITDLDRGWLQGPGAQACQGKAMERQERTVCE